jgi:hypothetical protein
MALALSASTWVFAETTEPIREAWRRPLGSVQYLAISADGTHVAVVTWASEVLCWEGSRLRWRRRLPGAEVVTVGAGGRAVVYTPFDAAHRDLLLIDPAGRPEGRITAGGPISALSVSPDGQSAAVGTAGGSIELHRLNTRGPMRRLELPGACQELAYDTQGKLVVTTSEPARLLLFSPDGRQLWQLPAPPDCEFRVGTPARTAGEGSRGPITYAAVVKADALRPGGAPPTSRLAASALPDPAIKSGIRPWPAPRPGEFQIVGIASNGKLLWRRSLHGRSPSLRVMTSSGDVAVGYERADRRKSVVRHHRVVACFGTDGTPRWEQGGMVYDPLLVSASPAGETVLSLCSGNRFWLLSGGGQQLWSYTMQAPVRMARASASGSAVAVTTSDGQLLLLTINPGAEEVRRRQAALIRRGMNEP